jgi:hypothetical protein
VNSDGNFAIVPVLRHSPELTVQYKTETGSQQNMKDLKEYTSIKSRPNSSHYGSMTANAYESANLVQKVFHRDVLLEETPL